MIPELGVNIDHVATVREARKTTEPDPIWAAVEAELGGADGITVHLREDRRHIQPRDVRLLRETVAVKLNLELACEGDVIQLALEIRPEQATLVPERREEVTTEGGLDVLGQREKIAAAVRQLQDAGIFVSLFLDPELDQIEAAAELGVEAVELHTGRYSRCRGAEQEAELGQLNTVGQRVQELGMRLHAGHGLNYKNVLPVARLTGMRELNIGHAIVARALFVGMRSAVDQMQLLLRTV